MASENWTILSAVFKWFGNLYPYEEYVASEYRTNLMFSFQMAWSNYNASIQGMLLESVHRTAVRSSNGIAICHP